MKLRHAYWSTSASAKLVYSWFTWLSHTLTQNTHTHTILSPRGKNLIKVMQFSSHTRRRHVLPRGATLPLKYSLFPESRAASWLPLPQTQGNWPTALCVHFNTSTKYAFVTTFANDGWCLLFYDSVQRCPPHTLTLWTKIICMVQSFNYRIIGFTWKNIATCISVQVYILD